MRGLLKNPLLIAALAIVVLTFAGEALAPGFASPGQLRNQIVIAAMLGFVAAGQNLVILAGREGIDLSVGAVVSLGALIAGNTMDGQNGMILPALAAALAATFVIGLINGLGVTLVRIPPLVMTLGTASVVSGLLTFLTSGIPSGRAAPGLTRFVTEPVLLGVPGLVLVWAAFALLAVVLLRQSRFGLSVYAIGANPEAARLSGIRVEAVRTLVFGLSSMLAGFAGFLLVGYTTNVFVGVGNQYVLPSIIAVVIGGTSLAGGAGGYTGTVLGAILLTLLQSLLTVLAIEPWLRQVIFGAVLLLLMFAYGRAGQLRG